MPDLHPALQQLEDQGANFLRHLERGADLLALGGSLHCEDRDNPPPPKNGLNVIAKALLHDESLASDADFSSLSRVATGCRTEGAWPPAGIGSAGTTFGDALKCMALLFQRLLLPDLRGPWMALVCEQRSVESPAGRSAGFQAVTARKP